MLGAAGAIGGISGCRQPGGATKAVAESEHPTELAAEAERDKRDIRSEHPKKSSKSKTADEVRQASEERETSSTEEIPPNPNDRSSWSPGRWSGLLGRFGTPKRVPLPRRDLDSSSSLAEESIPQSDIDDF